MSDHVFTLSMTFDDETCDAVMMLSDASGCTTTAKHWNADSVPAHTDNVWHIVRDLLVDMVGESF